MVKLNMTGDKPVEESIDLDAIRKELADSQKEIDEIGERIAGYDNHLDWFIRRYIELLDDIHREKLFTEDGADHAPEIVERIRSLGPDYVKCFLPMDLWEEDLGTDDTLKEINDLNTEHGKICVMVGQWCLRMLRHKGRNQA